MFVPHRDLSIYSPILETIPKLEEQLAGFEAHHLALENKLVAHLSTKEAQELFNSYVEVISGDLLEAWQGAAFDAGFWCGCWLGRFFGVEEVRQPGCSDNPSLAQSEKSRT